MTVTVEKCGTTIGATSVIFQKSTQRKESPNRQKFAQSGHPVGFVRKQKLKLICGVI
jgi:hypothetical protein